MKIFKYLIIMVFAIITMSGCAKNNNDGIQIVCTIFPEYDWAREVVGNEDVNIKLLNNKGIDFHSYQPSVDDMVSIKKSDIFICVGGESEKWVEDALKDVKTSKIIRLMDVLEERLFEEEPLEGSEHESEEEHENDEHVWLSIKNAKIIVHEIADAISEIDKEKKDTYQKNAQNYLDDLDDLDHNYKLTIDSAHTKALLFADRFPFRYLCEDYNLSYYAAFMGCSTESDASPETIVFLKQKVEELNLKAVIILENSTDKLANRIIDDKNIKILTLDAIQSVTIKQNKTYLSIMTSNLEIIKEALK